MAAATGAPPVQVNDAAWEAIEGAYDLQVHVSPDVIERRIDDLDLAKEFLKHKLKGFVLKSHYVPTYERAKVVTKANPGITAFGALTLNHSVGGLNPVAIEIAGRQQARSPELRAATSLARQLAKQGRREEARTLLVEIYNWFTEGFDTADLKEAKELLDELSA